MSECFDFFFLTWMSRKEQNSPAHDNQEQLNAIGRAEDLQSIQLTWFFTINEVDMSLLRLRSC